MAAALLSLVGVFVALYLFLYKIGKIGALVCGTGSCEAVQQSRWARFAGVDVSLIGLIGYLTLLALAVASLQPGRRSLASALTVLSGLGVLFSAYLTYIELFVLHAICRWCVGSALIVTSVFLAALLDHRHSRARAGS